MLKIISCLIPPLLVILLSIVCELVSKAFINSNHKFIPYLIYAILGILSSVFIYFIILKFNLSRPFLGGTKEFIRGLEIGLIASLFSGLLFGLFNKTGFQFNTFLDDIHLKMLANLGPSFLEEVGFRGGLVQSLGSLYGKVVACLGGSVPFGMAHLAGKLFGQPVGIMHVIGTMSAGLLLTLVYLKFGLFAAIACHWTWNSFCSSWIRTLSLAQKGGAQIFEGAWTTIAVLLCISFLLMYFVKGFNFLK